MESYMQADAKQYLRWRDRFADLIDQNQKREIDTIIHDFDAPQDENETVNGTYHDDAGDTETNDKDGWGVTNGGF